MKKTAITLCLALVFAVSAGSAPASGGIGPAGPGDSGSNSSAGTGPAIRPAVFSFCPGISDTAQVRNKGIDYVKSREFAEAVSAVANGTSRFAPTTVPVEWKDAADMWGMSFAANGNPRIAVSSGEDGFGARRVVLLSPSGEPIDPARIGLEERSCDSNLLFRASIEYRSRLGQEDVPLLYPHIVRQAASGLGRMVAVKMDTATRSASRADEIAVRIFQAEQLGAGECQPRELARAKADLAVARRGITDFDADAGVTEAALARAEGASGNLLEARRFASSRGIRCIPE